MKRKLTIAVASTFILAMVAVPTYAAVNDQQKAEIEALNKQIVELQKQVVDKYTEAGEITQAQADSTKANIDLSEQYRQQYSQQYGTPAPVPAQGYGYGNGYSGGIGPNSGWGYGRGYCGSW